MITDDETIEAAAALVAGMRALAEESHGWVRLYPGIPDERMDSWPVPVPEDVRTVLRAFGGFSLGGDPDVSFDHPENHLPPEETYCHAYQAGERDTYWILHPDTGTDWRFFVDVDPVTGRWGDVFAIVEYYDVERTSPSLLSWLGRHLDCARRALAEYEPENPDKPDRFQLGSLFRDLYYEGGHSSGGEQIIPVSAETARGLADPVLSAAAADLPDGAFLADFRGASYPATACFMGEVSPFMDEPPIFRRLHGGALVTVVADD